ncbi:hypothetical protein N431DRAFT_548857 [Stipitochalara longipes BDJ]|nr:hypothetical protein N431DRAFT_548857 [Stipitochalara longipes BDJ]
MVSFTRKINDAVAKSVSRENAKFLTEIRAGLATFFAMAYIISLLHRFCMGLFANMPIALAPGMGLNAYFTYTVVGPGGGGPVSYRLALTAVFVEGFVFVGLSLLGLRQWLAGVIPASIKLASGVGISLYLTIIGLTYSAGIGAITGSTSTPLELAGCFAEDIVDGVCAIIAGILLVSIISWPRPTSVTYFPYTPVSNDNFDFFKKVVTFHGIQNTLAVQDWNLSGVSGQFGLAFITFLYVDILDCTGTLYSMAHFAGAIDEETQDFEGSAVAYLVDALGISIGSLFGLSPVTAFIESGAGISEGGKTSLTAMTTGFCFFISIFFAPIFASIPPWATGYQLALFRDALPAFITLAVMPFTYSITYGLIASIVSYIIINTTTWLLEVLSGGRILVPDKEFKEPWTAGKGKRDFWHEDPILTEVERSENSTSTGDLSGAKVPAVQSRSDAEAKNSEVEEQDARKLD